MYTNAANAEQETEIIPNGNHIAKNRQKSETPIDLQNSVKPRTRWLAPIVEMHMPPQAIGISHTKRQANCVRVDGISVASSLNATRSGEPNISNTAARQKAGRPHPERASWTDRLAIAEVCLLTFLYGVIVFQYCLG